jgi:hypothetical protein
VASASSDDWAESFEGTPRAGVAADASREMVDAARYQPANTNPISAEFNNWLSRHPKPARMRRPSWAVGIAVGGGIATDGGRDDCTSS